MNIHSKLKAPALTDPTLHFEHYADRLCAMLKSFDWSQIAPMAEELADCAVTRRQVFLAGNGGSNGNAIHLANDFLYGVAKKPGRALRVHALGANPAVLTCLANDEGYERIFELQLRELANAGDVLIVFSGSGNSPNILKALDAAREIGMKSYAVLGYSGGKAKDLCDHALHFPVDDMQLSENSQTIVGHMLMQWLYENRKRIHAERA